MTFRERIVGLLAYGYWAAGCRMFGAPEIVEQNDEEQEEGVMTQVVRVEGAAMIMLVWPVDHPVAKVFVASQLPASFGVG